jgi:superfamily II DNA or RNA helicase
MANFQKVIAHFSTLQADNLNKGKVFENYCKWFLENDPGYAAQLKKVWLWDDWSGNWGRDKGIDLIAETHDGKIWAIQAKAYSENYYVTKEDIDRFLSESSRKNISFRLLISTTNNLGPNAREVIEGQEKPIGLCLLDHLEASPIDWSACLNNTDAPLKKERFSPRPHQEKALTDIIAGFEQSSRGQLHMACGTGKTLVGLWLAERINSNTTLVLVPSISLVAQLYREWSKSNSEQFNFYPLFVCSDITVNRKNDDDDKYIVHSSDIGFPVTTNAQDIVDTISRVSQPKVIFATYHSSPVIKEACALDPSLMFDLVIADEAHRCAGKASSDFATITHKDAIRRKQTLFMTATPKFFADHIKKTTQEIEYEIVSMDDLNTFGPVFHTLPFSDAIRDGLLTDYQVVISIIDNKTYQEYAERGRFVAIDDHETDARTLASQIMVAKAIKKYNLTRLISFHSRNKNAQEFVDSFPQALSLINEAERPTIHFKDTINGDMAQSDRSKILKRFKEPAQEGAALLANVRCLSEGVDVPTLDGIIFIDPKGSETDIIQAVGRAIRRAEDKHIGTILIPIFVDDLTNEEIALEQSCFKTVWSVVKALRAHDNILAEELDSIRLELGKRTYKSPPKLNKITFDIPVGVDVGFGEALKTKLVESASSSWMYYFGLLEDFKAIHGHCNVPQNSLEHPSLAMWVGTQRHLYNSNSPRLTSLRFQKLNEIGFVWNIIASQWEKRFLELQEYKKKTGHCNISQENLKYPKLATWVAEQKKAYKKNRLKTDQIKKLESLGLIFDVLNTRWEQLYEKLCLFKKDHGHCNVPHDYRQDLQLSTWISEQRKAFKRNTLSTDRIMKLNSIGFCWSPLDQYQRKMLQELERFAEQNSHCNVPQQHKDSTLGKWVIAQRIKYKKGKLPAHIIQQLNDLGFDWSPLDTIWEEMYRALCDFQQTSGHCIVPQNYSKNLKLGTWVGVQSNLYASDRLSPERIAKLNAIGFVWSRVEEKWETRYCELTEFKIKNGHCNLPNDYRNYSLLRWIGTQRNLYKKNKLNADRIAKLNQLGFCWDDTLDKTWNAKFIELCVFQKHHGHSNIPLRHTENPQLGRWANMQRALYKKGKLAQERISKLAEIGFAFDISNEVWEKQFSALCTFKAAYGHCKVPANYANNTSLGAWVRRQRIEYNRQQLSPARITRLNNIGFIWNSKTQ